jgi:hypothetical protein
LLLGSINKFLNLKTVILHHESGKYVIPEILPEGHIHLVLIFLEQHLGTGPFVFHRFLLCFIQYGLMCVIALLLNINPFRASANSSFIEACYLQLILKGANCWYRSHNKHTSDCWVRNIGLLCHRLCVFQRCYQTRWKPAMQTSEQNTNIYTMKKF